MKNLVLIFMLQFVFFTAFSQVDSAKKADKKGNVFSNIFGGKKKKKLEETQKENEKLANEKQKLEQEKNTLNEQKVSLTSEVAKQKTTISSMTEQQAKAQLLLAEKENLLNKLAFQQSIDSLKLNQKDLVLKEKESEIARQKTETELGKTERNLLLALSALVFFGAIAAYNRYINIKKNHAILEEKNKIIQEERHRSEELLLNILPAAIAEELKRKGSAEARHYDEVSVLFADFKGFTHLSQVLSPQKLVENLDFCFKGFDEIIKKYQLEKIKTIGDCYMAAGGLPNPDPNNTVNIVKAALEMQRFLTDWKLVKIERGEPIFEARIGIHTGPIVAGVVGNNKFAYDIWGDTVNVAARMEQHSEAGKINVSQTTYDLVKNYFQFSHRGKVAAKNKGMIDMYFVEN